MRFSSFSAGVLLALAVLAGCGDPTGRLLPSIVVTDSVVVFTPSDTLIAPTALNIAVEGFVLGGAVHPELPENAPSQEGFPPRWDFALRHHEGGLALVPVGHLLQLEFRAGLHRMTGVEFDDIRDVPRGITFVTNQPVPVQPGAVFIARSRWVLTIGRTCHHYAKMEVQHVDVAAGTARFKVTSNANCDDQRLVPTN